MMEDELVRRRQWLSREKFPDLRGASNLIPGRSFSELAIHIGYLLAGWAGLLVAGACFIVPAAVIAMATAAGVPCFALVREMKDPHNHRLRLVESAKRCGVKPTAALFSLNRTETSFAHSFLVSAFAAKPLNR